MQNLRETSKTCEKSKLLPMDPNEKKKMTRENMDEKTISISWGDRDYFNQTQVCELKFFHFRYRGLSDFEVI